MAKKDQERADEPLHNEAEEPVTEFPCKLNKYGFIHVPKKAIPSLPFNAEVKLKARIEKKTLIISAE